MSDDLIAIIGCCILGIMAHGARRQPWLEWVLRVTYCLFLFGEIISLISDPQSLSETPWGYGVLLGTVIASTLLLFKPGRLLFSYVFTLVNQVVAGRIFIAALGRLQVAIPAAPPKLEVRQIIQPRSAATGSYKQDAANAPITPDTSASRLADEGSDQATAAHGESTETTPTTTADADTTDITGTTADVAGTTADVAGTTADVAGTTADVAGTTADIAGTTADIAGTTADIGAGSSAATVTPLPHIPEATEIPQLRKVSFFQSFFAEKIFIPESIPHMNALWIYVTCLAFLLTHMEIAGFQMPSIMIPVPVTMDQLFSYNFLGLIMLSICGVGIFISRKPLEVLKRLGLVKPSWKHLMIGIAGIFMTFAYDYFWSTFTHAQEGLGYAEKLAHYNEGTFTGGASAGPAFLVASATGICAGFGEEILIRGALQPVFGIIPAAFMHGVLHGQFAHAPLLILQVFGWSAIMGIIRRYTNTTTTIITHVGFNFLSTFLIAFNP